MSIKIFDLESRVTSKNYITRGIVDFYVEKNLFLGITFDLHMDNCNTSKVIFGLKNDLGISFLWIPNPKYKTPFEFTFIPYNFELEEDGFYNAKNYELKNFKKTLSKENNYLKSIKLIKEIPNLNSIVKKIDINKFENLILNLSNFSQNNLRSNYSQIRLKNTWDYTDNGFVSS